MTKHPHVRVKHQNAYLSSIGDKGRSVLSSFLLISSLFLLAGLAGGGRLDGIGCCCCTIDGIRSGFGGCFLSLLVNLTGSFFNSNFFGSFHVVCERFTSTACVAGLVLFLISKGFDFGKSIFLSVVKGSFASVVLCSIVFS